MDTAVTLQMVLMEFAPLFGLSFSIFALKGFRMSHSARWTGGFWINLLDIILSSAIGAFLIVGFCIIVMCMKPQLDALAVIGLAIFLSVGGVSLVDSIVFKYFGVRVLDHHTQTIGKLRKERKGEDE